MDCTRKTPNFAAANLKNTKSQHTAMSNPMRLMRLTALSAIALAMALPAFAQERSTKRGVAWDEGKLKTSTELIDRIADGVSWYYNWGIKPQGQATNIGPGLNIDFYPMCWNGGFNETSLRQYLTDHPGTKYVLGFNEPNFSAQSNMTPESAATAWAKVEKLADDFNVQLVAPALNFTGEKVGGRTWSPYEWYDEFFRLRPDAHVDCLALHCYMNWYSATTWFATEYFYKDLYDSSKKDIYGRYPNLVAYLDAFKTEHGHFPRMMLTEFCSWENDGTIKNVDFQIDQMTQKVQKLEQNDLVEGYAWFMMNGSASSYPYWSLLQSNTATSPLSTLGEVYVHMSSFDTNRWYAPGETIFAKDYVDASTDDQQAKLRPSTDVTSDAPLQVQMQPSAWTSYQVNVPSDPSADAQGKTYTVRLRMQSSTDASLTFYVDRKKQTPIATLPSTQGQWTTVELPLTLKAGQHTIMVFNGSTTSYLISELTLVAPESEGINLPTCQPVNLKTSTYDLNGRLVPRSSDSVPSARDIRIVEGTKILQ